MSQFQMLNLLRKQCSYNGHVSVIKRFFRGRNKPIVDVVTDRIPVASVEELVSKGNEVTPKENHPPPVVNPFSKLSEDDLFNELSNVVTPLWNIPYHEQLEIKKKKNIDILTELTKLVRQKKHVSSPLCHVQDVIPSPVIDYYRNKEEFHVRYREGKVVCGLCLGQARNQTLTCVNPKKLLNIRKEHIEAAQVFEDYVQQSSWKVCEHFQRGGNWRQFTVRSNSQGDVMAIALIHPQDLNTEQISEEMSKFKEFFVRNMGNIKSLYFQACPHTRCNSEQAPFELLHGESHIVETIGKFRFRLSPESFFQVNTSAAEVLYAKARSLLKPTRMTTVLDLCCGIGTQGLMVADQVRGVVGIEVSADAIRDARFNASLNNIHNVEFYAGPVQQLLKPVLDQLTMSPDIGVILNPGRSGVHTKVIKQLRDNERIRRIVYISCRPEAAMPNFVHLLKSNEDKRNGEPFRLKAAVPVDMFPHTEHCELVMLFER